MKKLLNIVFWSLFTLGGLVLFSFTEKQKNTGVCQAYNIIIYAQNKAQFVTEENIQSLLKNLGYTEQETPMEAINTLQIEEKIAQIQGVNHVQVFKNINGVLHIHIYTQTPIVRLFNTNQTSFYIDEKGKIMPISPQYTARVLLVNGFINEPATHSVEELLQNDSLAKKSKLIDIFNLAQFIKNDEFLHAQIEQIYVEKNGEYTLIPKIGNQNILLGNAENMTQKLKKLKTFYFHGISPKNLNNYQTINLKYNQQIICTKK